MPALAQQGRNWLFRQLRRLARGSHGLKTKQAMNLALDILEANGVTEIAVRDGVGHKVWLPTADRVIASGVLRHGHYSLDLMERFGEAIRAHGIEPAAHTFVNVGANIGTSCLNAYRIGFRRLVAIEPDARNFGLLAKNLAHLDGADVRLENIAIGEAAGCATLHLHGTNHGAHSMAMPSKRHSAGAAEVPVRPLPAVLPAGEPFILLVDVEGFEPEVISGGLELILAQCRAICLEIAPSRYSEKGKRVLADFASRFSPSFVHVPSGETRSTSRLLEAMEARSRDRFFDAIMVSGNTTVR